MTTNDEMQTFKDELGLRLKNARLTANETQASAAEKLSQRLGKLIEPSRIGNYEQGNRLPDPLTVMHLCEIYGAMPSLIYGFPEAPATREEAALVMKYRQTDDRGRRAIQSLAESQPLYEIGERKSAAN